MATTKLHTRGLVGELCSLPAQDSAMFGVEPQQIRDLLGKAIERYAASDDHARRMVDWLLFDRDPEKRRFRPTPGEIREASESVSATKVEAPAGLCMSCDGSGAHIRGLVTWQETRPDGTLRRCREIVQDEQEALRRAAAMPPEACAMGTSCAVDCACRKVAAVTQ